MPEAAASAKEEVTAEAFGTGIKHLHVKICQGYCNHCPLFIKHPFSSAKHFPVMNASEVITAFQNQC